MTVEAAPDLIVQAVREIAAPGSVGLLGWWLSGQFRKTEERADAKVDAVAKIALDAAEKVAEIAKDAIHDHELIDQGRHAENKQSLKEINETVSDISLTLARNGINGKR